MIVAIPRTGDIQLSFSDDFVMEILSNSSGYEAWQVYGPGGVCYCAHVTASPRGPNEA